MGIRFYCSHCKRKLNVKAFQGGRQGLCPYCGGSIPIPTESTRPSSKEVRDRGLEAHPANPGGTADESPLAPQPLEQPLAGASLAPRATTTTPAHPSNPDGPMAPANPTVGRAPLATPAPDQTSEPAGPAASSPPAAAPSPIGSSAAGGSNDLATPAGGQSPLAAYTPQQPVGGSPSPGAAAVDPLEEAPDAVWYVRPPDGGQFGPAARDIMRGWIDEGRVTPDSLVWRDGWGDWQPASAVFTQLPARQPTTQPSTGASSENPAHVPAAPQRATGRRRPSVLHAAIIVILVLAVVVLSGVFIWIIQS